MADDIDYDTTWADPGKPPLGPPGHIVGGFALRETKASVRRNAAWERYHLRYSLAQRLSSARERDR